MTGSVVIHAVMPSYVVLGRTLTPWSYAVVEAG